MWLGSGPIPRGEGRKATSARDFADEVTAAYRTLLKKSKTGGFFKVDLHVHSPASRDYVRSRAGSTDEEEYLLFLDTVAKSDVSMIAITDHNTVRGYFEIQRLIEASSKLRCNLQGKSILPGVEITCYNKHILAIFPPQVGESRLITFLLDCGIELSDQGFDSESADKVSPVTLCEKVANAGGMVVFPHVDEKHGIFEAQVTRNKSPLDILGKPLERMLQSPASVALSVNSSSNVKRVQELRSNFRVQNLAIVRASDFHGAPPGSRGPGLPLGERATWIRLGELTFASLRWALENEESRVRLEPPTAPDGPRVMGLCVKGGFLCDQQDKDTWAVIPLSEELNCIIGARGTGKSTLIDILNCALNPKDESLVQSVLGRFDTAIVFLRAAGEILATRISPSSRTKPNASHYRYSNGTFRRLQSGLRGHLPNLAPNYALHHDGLQFGSQSYRQKEIFDLSRQADGPTTVINQLVALQHGEKLRSVIKERGKHRQNLLLHARELYRDLARDWNADTDTPYLRQEYRAYSEAHSQFLCLQRETCEHLNEMLHKKLRITTELTVEPLASEKAIEDWLLGNRRRHNTVYERTRDLRRALALMFQRVTEDWNLPLLLFAGDASGLASEYQIPLHDAQDLCKDLRHHIKPDDVTLKPHLTMDYELNINFGVSSSSLFRPRSRLSFGQKAVGMLVLILEAATQLGERRPIILDQPEDDLDNMYIYQTLVRQFSTMKKHRQLIVATHNPNIPVAGDSENVLVMQSDGEKGWVETSGSIDRPAISAALLRILEGDYEALKMRTARYGFSLNRQAR